MATHPSRILSFQWIVVIAFDVNLFTQVISLPFQSCNVTKVEDVKIDDVKIRWSTPIRGDDGMFRVNVTLAEPLDFEKLMESTGKSQLEVQLRVSFVCDIGGEQEKTLSKWMVIVQDVKDSIPEFQTGRYEEIVPENQEINTIILYNITAIDKDGNDQVDYTLKTSDHDRGVFEGIVSLRFVEGKNRPVLDIRLTKGLDYESTTQYSLTVTAMDTTNSSSKCDVIIRVKDIQDTPPKFSLSTYSGRVDETAPNGTSIVTVSAVDGDGSSIRNKVMYSIVQGPSDMFLVDNSSGVISTTGQLDVDGNRSIGSNGLVILTVQAEEYNSSLEQQYGNTTARTQVQIQIDDANDHPPTFSSPTYSGSIRGDAVVGEIVSIEDGGYISVTDQDLAPSNNRFRLHIEKDGRPWSVFDTNIRSQFVQASVLIVLKEPAALEKLQNTHIRFQIVATDFSSPRKSSTPASPSSVGEIIVFVLPRTTVAPPPEAIVDLPISESDVIVFIMGFLLLLNIVLTLLVCRLLRRNGKDGGLGLFRRNSKYYVSERKRAANGGVERVSSQKSNGNADDDDNGGALSQTKAPSMIEKESKALVLTDAAINRNTQLRNTVSSMADRNRCDVIHLNEVRTGKHNEMSSKEGGNNESIKERDPSKTAKSDRCDVTPLKPENHSAKEEPTNGTSRNFKDGSSNNKCDVIPLETSMSSTSKALSNLLNRVHQKLGPGSRIGKSDACDLRPLKEDNSSLDSSFNTSNNSSFSDKTKHGVTPLTEDVSTPLSPSHVNTAFVTDDTETNTLKLSGRGKNIPTNIDSKTSSALKQPLPNQQQQQKRRQPAPQSLAPTLSPSQTQITQTGVPPVALALPFGTNTTQSLNEDKRPNTVTVLNPVYTEDGNRSPAATVPDYFVPKPTKIMTKKDRTVDKSKVTSSNFQDELGKDKQKQIIQEAKGNTGVGGGKAKNEKEIQRASSNVSTNPKSKHPDTVDYVQAAKILLNSSVERVNSMSDKDDKKQTVSVRK